MLSDARREYGVVQRVAQEKEREKCIGEEYRRTIEEQLQSKECVLVDQNNACKTRIEKLVASHASKANADAAAIARLEIEKEQLEREKGELSVKLEDVIKTLQASMQEAVAQATDRMRDQSVQLHDLQAQYAATVFELEMTTKRHRSTIHSYPLPIPLPISS